MDIKNKLISLSESHINDEMCGFICLSDDFYFIEVFNRSPEPDKYFYIPSIEFLKIKTKHKIISIFHNHFSTTENESEFDKGVAENICYPMVIYSNITKKFNFYIPEKINCDVKEIERLKEVLND